MAERAPALILLVAVQFDGRVAHQAAKLFIFFFGKIFADGLVSRVREKAIQPTAVDIVGIARKFRELVMNIVRDHVNLFGDHFNDEISANHRDPRRSEFKRAMRAMSMQPERAMASHEHHAVDKSGQKEPDAESMRQEPKKRNREREAQRPTEERQPVFL